MNVLKANILLVRLYQDGFIKGTTDEFTMNLRYRDLKKAYKGMWENAKLQKYSRDDNRPIPEYGITEEKDGGGRRVRAGAVF